MLPACVLVTSSIVALIAIICTVIPLVAADFDPKLNVTSCTRTKLKLTVEDAADGGIMYIQGTNAACKQYTHPGVSEHIFDVRACAVTWNKTFRVIVQRHPLYQTGEDKRFPVICKPDTSTLDVGNKMISVLEKGDEEEITKTVRPSATMTLYRDGVDIHGKTVNVKDQITMEIQLESEHTDDFDIEATDCYGEDIQIIQNGCPVDEVLFPKFTKVVQGKLQATFGVFRPTKLDGGTVNMAFTCSLQVYLGQHQPEICDNREIRANIKRKLQADSDKVEEIVVGNSLLIDIEDISSNVSSENIVISTEANNGCVQSGLFISLAVLYAVTLLLTFTLCVCLHRKLRSNKRYTWELINDMRAKDLELERLRIDMEPYLDSYDSHHSIQSYYHPDLY